MNTRISASNLAQAMKELSLAWQQTRAQWRDAKAIEFDDTYLEVLPQHVARATAAMEELEALLKRVRSDCE
jgi:hypothetical protein